MVRNKIAVLEKSTIDKIAAGEVVERPSSVVKELVENAIDAGATAITVEIKDGGKSYIRITDNGCGIPEDELSVAFMRHSTSKLRDASELADIHTLGFRGEALSSISAVSRVEMITKPADTLMGVRYVIEGSKEVSLDKIGAPDGTTIMVYQLFFNTPARKKFLKTDTTEASYISELMERLALSHPDISFCFISNKKEKIHTSGNGNLIDTIYQIYGRQIASNLLTVEKETDLLKVSGFIGNSNVARGNRSLENFYINGRYIKSPLLSKSVEEGYVGYLMQHQYPFCVLMITTKEASVDVNVHPTKQEVRFDDEMAIADIFKSLIFERLHQRWRMPRKIQAPGMLLHCRRRHRSLLRSPVWKKCARRSRRRSMQTRHTKENIRSIIRKRKKSRTKVRKKRSIMSRPHFYPSRRAPSTVSLDRSLILTG